MKKFLYPLNLTKFDGEAAAPTGDGNSLPAAEEGQGEAKVVYGKVSTEEDVPAATEQPPATPDPEARKADFEKIIMGDYKDLFDERVHGIINNRFKETKTLEKQLNDLKPIMDVLSKRYGINDGDAAKLAKAIEDDNSLWEQEAMTEGLTVEQYKYQKKIEAENEYFRKQREADEQRRGAQETYNNWLGQANSMKNQYPNFNLDAEIRNPQSGKQFLQVLQATGDVRAAYHAINFDKILPSVAQQAEQKGKEEIVNNIQSRRSRPLENGANSSAGVIVKNDPSKWTDKDLDEVLRRVSMGEMINL